MAHYGLVECSACRQFIPENDFARHRHEHHEAKAYECRFCPHAAVSRHALEEHERERHTGPCAHPCRFPALLLFPAQN